jgi:hypothetical protein
MEGVLASRLPKKYFSHEVDILLHEIDHRRYDARYVFIGDSLGGQLLEGYKGSRDHAVLATNFAIEMAGQYFITRRYLGRNKKPDAIIFVGLNPFGKNLDNIGIENYVQRVFLRPGEILDMISHKGPRFGLICLLHKLFPSYRYRLHLQRRIAGFTNADGYSGLLHSVKKDLAAQAGYFSEKMVLYDGKPSISGEYFYKLLKLLQDRSIDFHFVGGPLSEFLGSKEAVKASYRHMFSDFERMRKEFSRFSYDEDYAVLPTQYFKADRVHGTDIGRPLMAEKVRKYLTAAGIR